MHTSLDLITPASLPPPSIDRMRMPRRPAICGRPTDLRTRSFSPRMASSRVATIFSFMPAIADKCTMVSALDSSSTPAGAHQYYGQQWSGPLILNGGSSSCPGAGEGASPGPPGPTSSSRRRIRSSCSRNSLHECVRGRLQAGGFSLEPEPPGKASRRLQSCGRQGPGTLVLLAASPSHPPHTRLLLSGSHARFPSASRAAARRGSAAMLLPTTPTRLASRRGLRTFAAAAGALMATAEGEHGGCVSVSAELCSQ